MDKLRILFVEGKQEDVDRYTSGYYNTAFQVSACTHENFTSALCNPEAQPFDVVVTNLRPQDLYHDNMALLIKMMEENTSLQTRVVIFSGAAGNVIRYALDELKHNAPTLKAIGISKPCSAKQAIKTINQFVQNMPFAEMAKDDNHNILILPSTTPFKECDFDSYISPYRGVNRYTLKSLKASLEACGHGS